MGPFPPAANVPPMVGQMMGQNPGVSAVPPGGGLPRLIFSVQQTLDTIARAVPDASEEIDTIKEMLTDVLLKATTGGSGKSESPMSKVQAEPSY